MQETRHWDEDAGRTTSGRSKEEAHDYRYFPEPDLVPVAPTDEMRAAVRASMPELPAARRARLVEEWGIKEDDARVIVDVPGLADYAERAVAALTSGTAKDVANWVRQDVLGYLNDRGLAPAVLAPEMLAELVGLVTDGTISRGQAKDVLNESMAEDKWPRDDRRGTWPRAGERRGRARPGRGSSARRQRRRRWRSTAPPPTTRPARRSATPSWARSWPSSKAKATPASSTPSSTNTCRSSPRTVLPRTFRV